MKFIDKLLRYEKEKEIGKEGLGSSNSSIVISFEFENKRPVVFLFSLFSNLNFFMLLNFLRKSLIS